MITDRCLKDNPRWMTQAIHSTRGVHSLRELRDTEPGNERRGLETQGGDHLGGLRAGTHGF